VSKKKKKGAARPARAHAKAAPSDATGRGRGTADLDARTLGREAWSLTKKTLPATAPVMVALSLPLAYLTTQTSLDPAPAVLIWILPSTFSWATVIAIGIDALDDGGGRIGPAMRRAISALLGVVVAALFSQLIILFLLLLLVIPGVLRFLSYLLVYPLVVSGESGGFDSLRLSAERMRGLRWPAFLACLATGWPVILGFVLDGLVLGNAFVSLVPGETAEVPVTVEVLLTLLGPFLQLPLTMLTVVLYHRPAPASTKDA
jgi:hypothetical protein